MELQYIKDVVASLQSQDPACSSKCDDVYEVAKKIEELHQRCHAHMGQ